MTALKKMLKGNEIILLIRPKPFLGIYFFSTFQDSMKEEEGSQENSGNSDNIKISMSWTISRKFEMKQDPKYPSKTLKWLHYPIQDGPMNQPYSVNKRYPQKNIHLGPPQIQITLPLVLPFDFDFA